MRTRRLALLLVLLASLAGAGSGQPVPEQVIGDFSQGLTGWSQRAFVGETGYRVVELDGEPVLEAHAEASASALYRDTRIDLTATPYLHFRWRIEGTFGPGIDERSKAGDDYPARIYVVRRGGLAFWRTRALNYVWASAAPVDARWPNAYAGRNAQMWVLDSGEQRSGEWVSHVRDVRADWLAAFGERIDSLDGLALMTDADDTGRSARAWYAAIRFSAAATSSPATAPRSPAD
jgi:hypothetical protein